MTQPFPHLGSREAIDHLGDGVVLVTVGTFCDACTLFVGCQNSGSTLAANPVWLTEVPLARALSVARALSSPT
jgi:hypothetical protein